MSKKKLKKRHQEASVSAAVCGHGYPVVSIEMPPVNLSVDDAFNFALTIIRSALKAKTDAQLLHWAHREHDLSRADAVTLLDGYLQEFQGREMLPATLTIRGVDGTSTEFIKTGFAMVLHACEAELEERVKMFLTQRVELTPDEAEDASDAMHEIGRSLVSHGH